MMLIFFVVPGGVNLLSDESAFLKRVLLGNRPLRLGQQVIECLFRSVYHSSVLVSCSLLITIIPYLSHIFLDILPNFIIIIILVVQCVLHSHRMPFVLLFSFLSMTLIPWSHVILASVIVSLRSLPVTDLKIVLVLITPSEPLAVLLIMRGLRSFEIIGLLLVWPQVSV